MEDKKPTLTAVERLMLANQFRILEKLEGDPAHGAQAEALESGFTVFYMPDSIHEDEVTKDECREVFDILKMHRMLDAAARKYGIDRDAVKFRGFDGNDEPRHHSFLCYLVETLGRYPELKITELNSHANTLNRYREMLNRWRKRKDSDRELSADDVKYIIA